MTIYENAKGEVPPQDKFKEWDKLSKTCRLETRQGNLNAHAPLQREYESLCEEFMHKRNNELLPKREKLKTKLRKLNTQEDNLLRLSALLQVLGIVTVLMKDIFSGS